MLSCIKATELVEKKSLVTLSLMDSVKLKLHMSMCKACRLYMQQSLLVNKFANKARNSVANSVNQEELNEFNERILRSVKK